VAAHSREPAYQARERLMVAQARCTRSSMNIQGVRHTRSQAFRGGPASGKTAVCSLHFVNFCSHKNCNDLV
jgi:hypothetical protein